MRVQAREPAVDERRSDSRRHSGGHERVEARPHVDVRPPRDEPHQRNAGNRAIAHADARALPHVVGDERGEERDRERRWVRADQLRGVPIRHLREDRATPRERRGTVMPIDVGDRVREPSQARGDGARRRRADTRRGRERPHLEERDPTIARGGELDLERRPPAPALDLAGCAHQPAEQRIADRARGRAAKDDCGRRHDETAGDRVGAA